VDNNTVRIYFKDDTFYTIKLEENVTAKGVCENLAKKKNLPEMQNVALYVSDTNLFLPTKSNLNLGFIRGFIYHLCRFVSAEIGGFGNSVLDLERN
jgi:hypothetical protein